MVAMIRGFSEEQDENRRKGKRRKVINFFAKLDLLSKSGRQENCFSYPQPEHQASPASSRGEPGGSESFSIGYQSQKGFFKVSSGLTLWIFHPFSI